MLVRAEMWFWIGSTPMINSLAEGRTEKTPQTRKMPAPTGPGGGRIAMKKGYQPRPKKPRRGGAMSTRRGTWHGAPRVAHKKHRGLARKKSSGSENKNFMTFPWPMAMSSCLAFRHHWRECPTSAFFNSLCGPVWMIFDGPETQHGELFPHRRTFFCLAEKNISEFTTKIYFCEFGFFSAKKKCPAMHGGGTFAMLGFRSIKINQIGLHEE